MTVDTPSAPITRVRRWTPVSLIGTPATIAVAVGLVGLPYLIGLATIYSMIDLFIFILLASMWNLLAGYGGMVSVGQQAYIGVGAYALVVLADQVGVNVFLAIPVAAVICALLAFGISFLAFRLIGGYFAIGTWVISEVLRLVAIQAPQLGAGSGLSLFAMSPFSRDLRVAIGFWLALACAALAVLTCVLLVRSRFGLGLMAVRDDSTAAATSGVDVQRAKRFVFVIAGAGSGIAGALIAVSSLNVQPDSVFSVQWSAFMIFMVVVGGVGTIEGPILGAILFWFMREALADYGPLYLIVLGIIGVAFALFLREGIWGLLSRRGRLSLFPTGYSVTRLR